MKLFISSVIICLLCVSCTEKHKAGSNSGMCETINQDRLLTLDRFPSCVDFRADPIDSLTFFSYLTKLSRSDSSTSVQFISNDGQPHFIRIMKKLKLGQSAAPSDSYVIIRVQNDSVKIEYPGKFGVDLAKSSVGRIVADHSSQGLDVWIEKYSPYINSKFPIYIKIQGGKFPTAALVLASYLQQKGAGDIFFHW